MKPFITISCIAVFSLSYLTHGAPPEARFPEKHRTFFKTHCLACHDSETKEGKVDLENLSFRITSIEQAELWQKVLNALNSGEMPPEDSEQPDNTEKADFLDDLAQTMVTARQALSDSGGNITIRRLNRREYSNSIEQLTGVKVDVGSLPIDGGSGTFDTVGSSQFISSDQFEQYLKLGRQAIDEAFERHAVRKTPSKIFRVEPEDTVNVQSRKNMKTMAETYQRYLLWKAEVDKAAQAPENQQILEQIREKYMLDDLTDNLRLYQNANLLKGKPDAKKFGFRDANAASFSFQGGYDRTYAYMKHYLELPHSDQGTYLKLAWAIQRIDVLPKPEDIPPGTYKLRIRAGTVKDSDPSRHFIEIGHPQRVNQVPAGFSSKPLASLQITGTVDKPEIIETTLVIGSNTPREFGIQERRPEGNQKALSREFYAYKRENGYGTPPAIWVDWIELEGPITETAVTESQIVRVEPENTANVKNLEIIRRLEDTYKEKWLPWKEGVDKAAEAAENREIVAALRKEHSDYDSHPTLKYQKAGLLKGAPDPRDYGGSDPINAVAALYSPYRRYYSYMKHYAELPHNDRGAYLKLSRGIQRFDVRPDPKDVPSGTYKLRIRVGAVKGSDPSRHFIEIGHPQTPNGTSPGFAKLLSTQKVSGTIENPEVIEVNIEIGASTPREFGIQERQPKSAKILRQEFDRHKQKNGYGTPPAIWIDWIELEGPLSSPVSGSPLQAILAKHLDVPNLQQGPASDIGNSPSIAETEVDKERARVIFTEFAQQAFRDVPPEAEFIDRLVAIYERRRSVGDSFEEAIRTPLSVILASPGFLYLFEPGDETDRRRLNDRELAVRLSYFLWSGPPDAELLQLAEQNKLHLPEVLRQQVDRLIADPRSDDFVAGFVHQWLDMERLDFFQFDVNLYRDFDESTRAATREEVYQSFAHLLRDSKEGSLGKLLKSDYIFANGLLATYYDLEGVSGDEFRKIKLPADSPRGGLLGMAAIHAMGSDGVASSPVERGAWVLRHLLNDPPPPAPPNVPQISRLEGQTLTTRERLLAHQEEAQCASCHRKIDPIGFGLENFNAAGKWRTEDSYQMKDARGRGVGQRKTWAIDASGAFHNGPKFSDYYQLRDLIASREQDFARGLTENLVEYALGRPFGFTDENLANEIVTSAKSREFAVSEFIHALVQSKAFRSK